MAQEPAKLRDMSVEELTKEEEALRESIWMMRMQVATGQLSDPHAVRSARKDLARVMTIRRELELKG